MSRRDLSEVGIGRNAIRDHVAARRWKVYGRAVATHTGSLSRDEKWQAALINAGTRAVLTSFTAAQTFGLRGWERVEIHLLVPAGARVRAVPGLPMVVHRTAWASQGAVLPVGRRHRAAPALVLAASSFGAARSACGILAAAVQQRITRADALRQALLDAPRTRHRALLLMTVDDIAMGAEALSEIDLGQLCRRNHLPPPRLQSVRPQPGGRRRYVDAEWDLGDGRRLAVEVDGAVHLSPLRWVDDQLRQNELVLADTVVLRYPAVVVRTDEPLVAGQIRRGLGLA